MNILTSSKVMATVFMLSFFCYSFSQSHTDGDALSSYLGKNPQSQEFINLKNDYKLEIANEAHYLSKDGIELLLKDGVLDQINLYKTSSVYGNFMGKLPHGLAFSMTPANVKQLLGKPSVAYTSGYDEFKMDDCIIACWFDGGRLSQVSLSRKG